jgi:hypothetical protein
VRGERRAVLAEAAATGAWLGLVQVALGFALLRGGGSSSSIYFALLAAWLAGGALGALGGPAAPASAPAPAPAPASARLLALALLALAAARAALLRSPFSAASAGAGLLAGALAGGYAGRFLRDRAGPSGDARALLLHENNGFIGGFVAAGALDATAGALGGALLLWRLRDRARGG